MSAASLKPTTIFSLPAANNLGVTAALRIDFIRKIFPFTGSKILLESYKKSVVKLPTRSLPKFLVFAFDGESAEARTGTQEKFRFSESENEDEAQEVTDGTIVSEKQVSVILDSLQLYKEALANNDFLKSAATESFLKTIEDDKVNLEMMVVSLTEEISSEKARILRISADFENYRKRTERERALLVTNAQGEVVENLLRILDNFERAKAQIKPETEAEEKISNSYQSIYKQFVEILGTLGVARMETLGKPFDPMANSRVGLKLRGVKDIILAKLYKICKDLMKTRIHL